jgi:PPM family protein phosphatase
MLGDTSPVPRLNSRRGEEALPAAITDIGCEREINEDRYSVVDSSIGRTWVVCDGMGGALGGELAAQLAIDAVRRALESREFDSTGEALKFAIEEANRIIVLRRQNPAFSGMGTTVVAVTIQGNQLVLAHAGDSRAYLVRGSEIQQLTVDHTYVQDLVERGAINPEEALSHPQAHVLTRCLGAEPRLSLELQTFWLWDQSANEAADNLVLCSDGLYSLVSDTEMADVISKLSPQEACAQLVEMARSRGGYDNITVAIIPLGGQLREECPDGGPVLKRRTREFRPAPRPLSNLSPGKRLMLGVFLLMLGSLSALLFILFVYFGE